MGALRELALLPLGAAASVAPLVANWLFPIHARVSSCPSPSKAYISSAGEQPDGTEISRCQVQIPGERGSLLTHPSGPGLGEEQGWAV